MSLLPQFRPWVSLLPLGDKIRGGIRGGGSSPIIATLVPARLNAALASLVDRNQVTPQMMVFTCIRRIGLTCTSEKRHIMGNNTSSNRELLDAGAVKLVEEAISHNCVVIFSKTSCPFCTMAKNVFSDLNVAYTVIELDMQENGNQLQAVLHQMTGDRTVPRVFVNGTCIGGGTDTRKLHQQGKLLPLVRQCAASYEH
ncbi:glutaredoxin 2 [Pleurodeles waltl]|uniref:glutaredoxin 2 n=1 Tax=Pleurodeles waltl TaxID=8319 RepID=UPI00370991E3